MKSFFKYFLQNLCKLNLVLGIIALIPLFANAASGNWSSPATAGNIAYTVTEAALPLRDYSDKYLTVVYLENLGFNKIGQNSNAEDVAWLLEQGYRVIELDYAHHVNAVSPNINMDIIAINDAIASGSFCGFNNSSSYRSYILFEGYRIARDIAYFKDDPNVYNRPAEYTEGDSLYMDIIYPANTKVELPVVLSFSYSNSYATYDSDKGVLTDANKHLRLHLGYTLAGFDDSFLEGAPARGIAWAIADHPKYCSWGSGKPVGGVNDSYKSYQTNPDAAQKVKSAIRTLRTLGNNLGLSGKIGIYGFSRGSDAGAMAVGDRYVPELENAGLHIGVSDDVQAAALGPGVFDFTQIYNATDDGDGNLETRCPWVWGPLDENFDLWESMGAAYLVQTDMSAPVLFFYNTSDSHYYQDQIQQFNVRLEEWAYPASTLIDYGSGHSVPKDTASLLELYQFFDQYLSPPSLILDTTQTDLSFAVMQELPLVLSLNTLNKELLLSFSLSGASEVQILLYDMAGMLLFSTVKACERVGVQTARIHLDKLRLQQGVYHVKVLGGGRIGTEKFVLART